MGVTSGAQDFKNVEQFGYRHLNRADSENHPAQIPEDRHSSAIDLACRSLKHYWRQVVMGAIKFATAVKMLKVILWDGKVLFRFLSVRQVVRQ